MTGTASGCVEVRTYGARRSRFVAITGAKDDDSGRGVGVSSRWTNAELGAGATRLRSHHRPKREAASRNAGEDARGQRRAKYAPRRVMRYERAMSLAEHRHACDPATGTGASALASRIVVSAKVQSACVRLAMISHLNAG